MNDPHLNYLYEILVTLATNMMLILEYIPTVDAFMIVAALWFIFQVKVDTMLPKHDHGILQREVGIQ